MLNVTKLTLTATATALALVAAPTAQAQDKEPILEPELQAVDIFTSADIDADGALDRDEFISFVVMKSDANDADYSAIKLSGAYDEHFNVKDHNADGLLTAEELSSSVSDDGLETEDPEMEEGSMERADEAD